MTPPLRLSSYYYPSLFSSYTSFLCNLTLEITYRSRLSLNSQVQPPADPLRRHLITHVAFAPVFLMSLAKLFRFNPPFFIIAWEKVCRLLPGWNGAFQVGHCALLILLGGLVVLCFLGFTALCFLGFLISRSSISLCFIFILLLLNS